MSLGFGILMFVNCDPLLEASCHVAVESGRWNKS